MTTVRAGKDPNFANSSPGLFVHVRVRLVDTGNERNRRSVLLLYFPSIIIYWRRETELLTTQATTRVGLPVVYGSLARLLDGRTNKWIGGQSGLFRAV